MFGFGRKEKQTGYIRRAHHAGSWYEDSHEALNTTLSTYLTDAEKKEETKEQSNSNSSQQQQPLRAIVSPHAGFAYSGPTAAYAYRALVQALQHGSASCPVQHIVVLHPSHHVYLDGCAVSGATSLSTPLGSLAVDVELRDELLSLHQQQHKFTIMEQDTDEEEHSGEMQYPYIVKALLDAGQKDLENNVKVLPIMVGAINTSKEQYYGQLLGPILARPNVVTIVSSDFCHWGSRFQYQPFISRSSSDVFSKIEDMDRTGMTHIEMQNPGAFARYIQQTSNTICGRHAIAVWLNAVQANREAQREVLDVKFVRYAQSSQVKSRTDSSVSYASAVARTAAAETNGDASASLPN